MQQKLLFFKKKKKKRKTKEVEDSKANLKQILISISNSLNYIYKIRELAIRIIAVVIDWKCNWKQTIADK